MKMRTIKLPELSFTQWAPWNERNKIKAAEYPGVFLIAITKKNLTGKIPEYKDVSYIGMTRSKNGLNNRWAQFHRAINGNRGHSGGRKIHTCLGP